MERPLSPVSGPTPTAPLNFISDQTRHCCGWEHAMPVALSSEAGGNYVDQVRNWGETHLRAPEESAGQQLAPPRRQACNAGTLNTRLNSSLILEPPYGHEEIATKSKKSTTLSGLEKEEVTTTPSSKEQSIASTHEGRKTVPLRILPIGGLNRTDNQELRASASATGVITKSPPKVGFTPLHLLDVENGTSILVTNQKFDNPKHNLEPGQEIAVVVSATTKLPTVQEKALFFQERGPSFKGRIRSGFVREFERRPEFAMMDGARRGVLRRLLLWALDDINAVRMGSQLRLFLPFLTAHESYLLSQVMEALDTCNSKVDLSFVIKIAFQNENISRILAESFGARWSFLWHSYQQVSKNGRLNFARQLSPVGGQSRNLLFPNDPTNSFAANLGSASVGIKSTDSDQFGTLVNRLRYRNNQLLLDQRVPKEASIVRAFVEQPLSTMMNHGVVHTIRQLAKHWHNILYQPSGNFSHHRSEQLDPFEMMRTHIPVVCLVLCSIRGRTRWDATVLSHFIRKCQELKPSFGADGCRYLAREMQDRILGNLTAGVASLYDPLHSWLDAIVKGCDLIEDEAKEVHQKVTSVEVGLRLGHDLISQVSWKIPSAKELKDAILMYIKGKNPGSLANENRIQSAFLLITPHDKHTLIDLVKHGLEKSQPAKLLLDRVKNLVHRDIRREALNEAIRELSLGEYVTSVAHDEWYWLEEGGKKSLYICKGKGNGKDDHRFINVNSGNVRFFSLDDENTRCRVYIPVAESISRAQRCFMNIELEHGKKFSYSAFMDFPFLRIALRRLMVVSQIFCEQLDKARLNVLREVQRSLKTQVEIHDMEVGQTYYTYDCPVGNYTTFHCQRKYSPADPEWNRLARLRILKAPPQSMVVIGGGPIGLITAIHCTENVLLSGGVMQLHEARVALHVTGATYERSEITPLDAKWISMLRYHLGMTFEDIFIPISGQSESQLGNIYPREACVEITMKDLANVLHAEMSRMWSAGIIEYFPDSEIMYSPEDNAVIKPGMHLKLNDVILRRVDSDGERSDQYFSWKVAELVHLQPLGVDELCVGHKYEIFVQDQNRVAPFEVVSADMKSRSYSFKALKEGVVDLTATADNLPFVYPKGTCRHAEVSRIVVEYIDQGYEGEGTRQELLMHHVKDQNFKIELGQAHVVECIGQPHESPVHFQITPNESYGICCIQGLKISMGMHEFGEKSRANSLLKDFRSTNKTKTRMTGDSGLTIRQTLIAEQMLKAVKTNTWQQHFKNLLNEFNIPSLDELDPLVCSLKKAVMEHALSSKSFKLQNLRMQLSATRDNMYIGMEITREYEKWKNDISDDLIGQFITKKMSKVEMKHVGELRTALMHHIDRLWFESCLEIMRESDIYGLRAGHLVPKFFTIDDTKGTSLNNILIGESFRLMDSPEAIYEVLVKMKNQIVVRNAVGFIVRMEPKTMVYRGGNLTRELDRNKESKFSLATFSVGHHVNHRTVRLSNKSEGYVFATIFDEQSTRHLMPYSGLSGACTNVMLFNDFVKEAIHGVSFVDRLARFSSGRDWSSSEVVTSGVGSLFGRDSFLRPGFSYVDAIEYIYCKVIERMETGQYLDDLLSGEYLDDILSRDWKAKFAASLIPRGMELNKDFISAMYERIQDLVFEKFVSEVKKDKFLAGRALVENLLAHRVQMKRFQNDLNRQSYWTYFVDTLEGVNDSTRGRLRGYHVEIAFRTDQSVVHIIEYATKGYLYNERIVAEICSEPRSVDTVFENFAMDAQHMANSLVLSAAFSSGALAFVLFDFSDQRWGLGKNFGSILAGLNIIISFGTMMRVSRYKKRNEEARVSFFDDKLLGLLQASFASMSIEDQNVVSQKENPFVLDLDNHVQKFREHASYYGVENFEASGFSEAYNRLRQKVNDPAAVRGFQYKLATVFIAVVYHENSHVQECLVDIYKICANMLRLREQENDIPRHRRATQHLFRRLSNFTPRLGKSVLSGNITHWHIFTVLRYFWSVLCCTTMCGANPLAPIQTEILGILREVRNVSAGYKNTILLREIRDLETLYRATCESDTASIIFVAAFLVHVVSWIFSSYRIISLVDGPSIVRDMAIWASLASSLSAIIGAFHFQRKFLILFRLWCILGGKVRAAPTSDDKAEIMKIKAVTFGRMVLSSLRLLAAYGAGVALGGSIAIFQFSDQVGMVEEIPFWIAMGAVSSAILAMIMERIIQSRLYYRLSPRLGEYVCEAFRTEIELMHMSATMSMPFNDIDTKQEQEREAWEYTAREFLHKYRWDAVFEADRFGSILQYLQSGMDPRA